MNRLVEICTRARLGAAIALVAVGMAAIVRGDAAAASTPNDTQFSSQWALAAVRAPEAWDVSRGSTNIRVAIVDTGVNSLPDLVGQLAPGFNAVNAGGPTTDDFGTYGSGTQIAGIIGAATNNGRDMAGMAWNVQLVPVKVCDRYGCQASDLAEGIDWAAAPANDIDVIHISIAMASSTPAIDQAIASAIARGVIVIAAAGNVATRVGYPAANPGVLAVGATTSTGTVASFSGRGAGIDMVAPGENVMTLVSGGCCLGRTGTEHGAAHVTGAAALLLAAGVAPSRVAASLTSGASDMGTGGWDTTSGFGELDVCQALVYGAVPCGGGGAVAPCADVTGDQQSDLSDVLEVLAHYGDSGTTLIWDLDRDSMVQLNDALVLLDCISGP